MAIESADYERDRLRLMADPTVQAMALGCRNNDRADLAHPGPDGGPLMDFMLASLREYESRTTRHPECHIGGVAEAILRLLDLPRDQWPQPTPEQLRLAFNTARVKGEQL
jgi:hypothetical protein